ncbi:hypothetical protein HID58_055304, partial [Brassica napus]
DDGLHFRQPWVFAIQDEVKGLLQRVYEMAVEITDLKDQLKRVQILKLVKLLNSLRLVYAF